MLHRIWYQDLLSLGVSETALHVSLNSVASRPVNNIGQSKRRIIHRLPAGRLRTTRWNWVTCRDAQMRSQQQVRLTLQFCGSTITSRQIYERLLDSRVTKVVHVNCTSGCQTGETTSGRNLFVSVWLTVMQSVIVYVRDNYLKIIYCSFPADFINDVW